MNKKTIIIDSKKIDYYHNSTEGSPVFFIHGNSAGGEVFAEQLNSTVLSKNKLIALDLPGCGSSFRSDNPGVDYTISHLTNILEKFIYSFGYKTYKIVAHSLGGHLILECAEKLKGMEKLILFGTPPLGNTGKKIPPFIDGISLPLLFKNSLSKNEREKMSEALIEKNCENFYLVEQLLSIADGKMREQLGVEVATGKLKDEVEEFKNLSCKKYILHGAYDKLISLEYIALFEEYCSDKKIHVLEKLSHYPQLENPMAFNKTLADLLKE